MIRAEHRGSGGAPVILLEMPSLPVVGDGVVVRHVLGWHGYAVSSDGRVFCCRARKPRGAYKAWREMKLVKGKHYYCVSLSCWPKRSVENVHVLVLATFVGPRPKGMHGCHNDGNPLNNNLINLRWDTYAENTADIERHGRLKHGEGHHNAKLTADAVEYIRAHYLSGSREFGGPALGRKFGVTGTTIRRIASGEYWHRTLHGDAK